MSSANLNRSAEVQPNLPPPPHAFDRSGIARLSDLAAPEVRALFQELEAEQKAFLNLQSRFRSDNYRWPLDPLHTWSRCWEYPFVYHHLRQLMAGFKTGCRVVDFGSGVTFFPFTVARLGGDVCCLDTDPICGTDLTRAAGAVAASPGRVNFKLCEPGKPLPLADASVDILYTISVLEHIPRPASMVDEFSRVLAPRGYLVLTCDLDLRGDQQISVSGHSELLKLLYEKFSLVHPPTLLHPADVLNSNTSPYPLTPPRGWNSLVTWAKWLAKKCLGRPAYRIPFVLSVEGSIFRKRQ